MCQVQAWPRRISRSGMNKRVWSASFVLHGIRTDFTLGYWSPAIALIYGVFNGAISSLACRALDDAMTWSPGKEEVPFTSIAIH
jgi:hypothetical protein